MKGTMEISEDFLSLIHMVMTIVTLLAFFFIFNSYNVSIVMDRAAANAVVVGNAVLAAPCLTALTQDGYAIRGLLQQDKLEKAETDGISCVSYPMAVGMSVRTTDQTFVIGVMGGAASTELPAAVRMSDGRVVPATVTIKV